MALLWQQIDRESAAPLNDALVLFGVDAGLAKYITGTTESVDVKTDDVVETVVTQRLALLKLEDLSNLADPDVIQPLLERIRDGHPGTKDNLLALGRLRSCYNGIRKFLKGVEGEAVGPPKRSLTTL